jgi:acyl carrier protein
MTAMAREEIRALVVDTLGAIAPEVDLATISPTQPLRAQVDIDSFDFLNVIIRLSEQLKIEIPEADYGELMTLDGMLDYLAKKQAAAS